VLRLIPHTTQRFVDWIVFLTVKLCLLWVGTELFHTSHKTSRHVFSVAGAVPFHWHTRVPASEHRAESNQYCYLQTRALHKQTVCRPHILHRREEHPDGEGACLVSYNISHNNSDPVLPTSQRVAETSISNSVYQNNKLSTGHIATSVSTPSVCTPSLCTPSVCTPSACTLCLHTVCTPSVCTPFYLHTFCLHTVLSAHPLHTFLSAYPLSAHPLSASHTHSNAISLILILRLSRIQ